MQSRWVTVGLVALATLGLAGLALADVPSDLTSTVSCECQPDPVGGSGAANPDECTLCPGGDGDPVDGTEDIVISVIVRNVLGQPLAGSNVVCTAAAVPAAGDAFAWDNDGTPIGDPIMDPQSATTAVGGTASFVYDQTAIVWNEIAGTGVTLPNLDFLVTAQGPGPGLPVTLQGCNPQLKVISYDMAAGDGLVGLQDFGDFASCWNTLDQRSDFNWSGGVVNLQDFGAFATHWDHKFADN